MRRPLSRIWIAPAVVLAWVGTSSEAAACAACAGRSNDAMITAYYIGAISLVALVVTVLGGITAFFVRTARRAARLANPQPEVSGPLTR
jgi:heme/copper-type cytochrome/quinol oxidase subunit 2